MTGHDRPLLSVVIPVRDGADTLAEQLTALTSQPGPFEVLVCDNGSTDGTRALVEQAAADDGRVRYVLADGARGSSHARNRGVEAARAELIAFCDADDVVGPRWVEGMVAALSQGDVATGPVELDLLNSPEVLASRGRWIALHVPHHFDGIFPFGSGCNLGVTREAFRAVGGFDESGALLRGEDIEFCMRLWHAGRQMAVDPRGLVHYRFRADTTGMMRQAYVNGRIRPLLHRRLADLTGRRPAVRLGVRQVLWLVRNLPAALRPGPRRSRWLWALASLAGHARGSVSSRVLCLA